MLLWLEKRKSRVPESENKMETSMDEQAANITPKRNSWTGSQSSLTQERSLSHNKLSTGSELARKIDKIALRYDANISDEVFSVQGPPANPAGGTGQSSLSHGQMAFPPTYGTVRASKAKKNLPAVLGNLRVAPRREGGAGTLPGPGLAVEGDDRAFTVQNYHSTEKSLNISLSIGKTAAGKKDDMLCLACQTEHSFTEKLEAGLPITVILSDQHFPPPPTSCQWRLCYCH